jgi:hypothetical protein
LTLGTAVYQQDYLIPNYTSFGSMITGGNTVVGDQTITNVWTVQTTNNPGSVAQATWVTGKTDWIPVAVGGQGYQVGVFVGPPGLSISSLQGSSANPSGPPRTVPVPINGIANDSWFFDYQAGILNFVDQAVPATVANTSNVIYITGAVYSGYKGVSTWANLSTAGNITSTNGNLVMTNGNVYAQNYYGTFQGTISPIVTLNLANVATYTTITPLTTNQSFYLQFANISSAGNSITGVNSALNFNPSTGTLSSTNFSGTGSFTTEVSTNFSSGNVVMTGAASASTLVATNFSTGNARIIGGYADNFPIGANTKSTGGFTSLTATGTTTITGGTDATSTTTGILQVTGGAGITGNLWVGGNIYAANIIATVQNQITVSDPLLYLQATGNLGLYNYDIGFYSDYTAPIYVHTGLARNVNANAWIFFSNVKSEPSATTINWNDAGLIYDAVIAGNILVANTTPATSTTSGALQVKGGAGIVGSLYITNTNDVSANIGTITNSAQTLNANVGAFEIYANANIGTNFNNLNTLTANVGAFHQSTSANIGVLFLGNASTQANLGSYQNTTNANIDTLFLGNASTNANLGTQFNNLNALTANVGSYENTTNANIGTIFNNLNTLQANVGSYENTTNANIGTIFNNLNTLQANVGSYENTTNANIGTIFNNLNTLTANVGAFEIYANANIGSQFTNFNTLNANVGSYENTTNANIGTLFLGNASTNANIGSIFNNLNTLTANVGAFHQPTSANIGVLYLGNISTNANLGTVYNRVNTLDANVGAFETYANTKIGTNTNSNLVVVATSTSTSTTTGALVVGGGVGIAGNVNTGANVNISGATILNSGKTAGYDTVVKGKTDETLIWARPNATYDTVVIGGSATASTVVNGAKLLINSTDTIMLPVGTSAQRPTAASTGTDTTGMFRYSTTAGTIEWYNGSTWVSPSSEAGVIIDQQFNGDGSTVAFTLSQVGTTTGAIVNINGIVQIPTLAYSVTGTTLTFTEAPALGDIIDVRLLTLTTTVASIVDGSGFNAITATSTGITLVTGATTANTIVQWNTNGAEVRTNPNISIPGANTPTTIDTLDNTQYRSAKYVVQVTSGTSYQVTEALVIGTGTTATIVIQTSANTASNLGILSATVIGGNTALQYTAVNGSNFVRVKKDYIAI